MNKHILYIITAALVTLRHLFILSTLVAAFSCTKEKMTPPVLTPPVSGPEGEDLVMENGGFTANLPEKTDTILFKDAEARIGFIVDAVHTESVKAGTTANGAKAEAVYDASTGRGQFIVTPIVDKGRAVLSLTDGTDTKEYAVVFDTWFLRVPETPSFNVGENAHETSLTVETNLPEDGVVLTCDSWFSATYETGRIVLLIKENDSEAGRSGTLTVAEREGRLAPVEIAVFQAGVTLAKPGCVQFQDIAFKKAMTAAADTDRDGFVSLTEAEAVREIDIAGKGVRDLAGLESFVNAERLDARDNDIEDADVLAQLHRLHWLDLRGNKNLRTFDLTGCSIYFDYCLFEATDDLAYRVLSRQIGVAGGGEWSTNSDPWCEHSVHVRDERQTADWSRQNRLVKLHDRTKAVSKDGRTMEYSICLTGIGYIDADLEDGSYDRLMRDAAALLRSRFPKLADRWDCFDVYYMERLIENRYKWMECPAGSDWKNDPKARSMKEGFNAETEDLLTDAYDAIAGDNPDSTKKVFIVELNLHPAPHQQGIPCDCLLGTCYPYASKRLAPRLENAYHQRFIFSPYVDDFKDEEAFILDQTPVSLIDNRIDQVVEYIVGELF